jgi:hypothetical protein
MCKEFLIQTFGLVDIGKINIQSKLVKIPKSIDFGVLPWYYYGCWFAQGLQI